MTITIGKHSFDHAAYDERGDVLYLHAGDRHPAADSEGTPEGHLVRFGEDEEIVGVTIINARWLLDRDGEIAITLPEIGRIQVEADALAPALGLPAV